ncbi:monovalent cation/H(+) antiporter subunit G [Kribbia dieselivorans]|uniref:monovalent cation/H(+) antiporter subunit G n=1 Tax=Kribbia dieselivorans TaxID=331526 RepID=UPI000B03B3A8|nr:monovalent cation/H(+) antiporter subunit G [Kribbia dieselivorans]
MMDTLRAWEHWGLVFGLMDLTGYVFLILGAFLCLTASIGMIRFPDLLSRQHAATKPQVLGVLLIMGAVLLHERSISVLAMVLLVSTFQLVTAPVASQMMSRAAVRTVQVELGTVARDPVNPPGRGRKKDGAK